MLTLASSVNHGAALTSNDSLNGLFEVFLVDGVGQMASCDQSCLVANVGNVGTWQDKKKRRKLLNQSSGGVNSVSLDKAGRSRQVT